MYQKWSYLFVLACALASGCVRQESRDNERKLEDTPARAVEAVTVTAGQLNRNIEASGVIAGINEAFVVSETQGIITRVRFELGDSVSAGNVLVKVDDALAKLNMEQAEQSLKTAQMDLNTTEKLFEKAAASKAELVRKTSAFKAAKAVFESAQKVYADCSVRARINGRIAHKEPTVTVGNFLAAGTRVGRIVDIDSLKLEVAVGEREVGFIEEKAKVSVKVPAACDQKLFDATVKAVAAGADPATGSYTVLIVWGNTCDRRLRSGMSAIATIQTRQQEPVLLVPSSAIVKSEGREAVFISVKKRATLAYIRTGRTMGNRTEVLDGLTEGELVVLSGLSSLAKGDELMPTVVGESGSWE